ncbi:DUF1365 domain-containing protein [Microvirga sp. W0021]|uniref:DUF1365 domain-containing protein n=1 Tax=Hohaiivirga grylli TaxID=3133970 RepID=A0ABV0BKB7_9HYPH
MMKPGLKSSRNPLFDAVSLYPGKVMHARLKPVGHRFSYRVFYTLIDLGRLEEANRQCWLFSVDRFNLISFHQKDHGDGNHSSLRQYAIDVFAKQGLDIAGGQVFLLAYPRILGYTFNPIAIYYAYDCEHKLKGLIYEVSNTFGQRHSYVVIIPDIEEYPDWIRHSFDKNFYVSPFMEMGMRYNFRITPPEKHLKIHILETENTAPTLVATFSGERQPMRIRYILWLTATLPLMPVKVICGIHWEALKLWLKGIRFHKKPPPPVSSVSYVSPPQEKSRSPQKFIG